MIALSDTEEKGEGKGSLVTWAEKEERGSNHPVLQKLVMLLLEDCLRFKSMVEN